MDAYNNKHTKFGLYSNETFVPIGKPESTLLKLQTKRLRKKETLYRVRPGPDPNRPQHETEFLTEEQIHKEAENPSTHWILAGSGNIGKLYLEVIGCDGLPNMDSKIANIKNKVREVFRLALQSWGLESSSLTLLFAAIYRPILS